MRVFLRFNIAEGCLTKRPRIYTRSWPSRVAMNIYGKNRGVSDRTDPPLSLLSWFVNCNIASRVSIGFLPNFLALSLIVFFFIANNFVVHNPFFNCYDRVSWGGLLLTFSWCFYNSNKLKCIAAVSFSIWSHIWLWRFWFMKIWLWLFNEY